MLRDLVVFIPRVGCLRDPTSCCIIVADGRAKCKRFVRADRFGQALQDISETFQTPIKGHVLVQTGEWLWRGLEFFGPHVAL